MPSAQVPQGDAVSTRALNEIWRLQGESPKLAAFIDHGQDHWVS
jgi:hypothetical protein